MNTGAMAKAGFGVLALASALLASGQSGPGSPSVPGAVPAVAEAAQVTIRPIKEILREIDDPHTGARWLLTRDAATPAGPGRLVLVEGPGGAASRGMAGDARQTSDAAVHAKRLRPVIRWGDALVVEEHTAVVDARLEAVALGSAEAGAELKARLKIGGKIVRVIAVAAGRAALAPEREAQP